MQIYTLTIINILLLFSIIECMSCSSRPTISPTPIKPTESFSPNPNILKTEPPTPLSLNEKDFLEGIKIEVVNFHENNDKLHYVADLDYPQIKSQARNIQKYNHWIKKRVFKELISLRNYCAENIKEPNGKERTLDFEITTLYTGGFARAGIISLELNIETSTEYVHPDRGSIIFNYDLTQGKELKLSDLFIRNSQFLNKISQESLSALKKKYPQNGGDWIPAQLEAGTAPLSENYDVWSLDGEELVITFKVYQIGPGSIGVNFATVPYPSLKDILKPELIERLTKSKVK